ncbi:hypothetical protein [Streptomyces sp. NPDC049887]|uniref:hypothetical protein n=1 Tax=Streptomyces sp. NPDC049887 TaxID=3155654 RepID=UPI003433A0F8
MSRRAQRPSRTHLLFGDQRHRERLSRNHRMARPVAGLDRLPDLPELLEQKRRRGRSAP